MKVETKSNNDDDGYSLYLQLKDEKAYDQCTYPTHRFSKDDLVNTTFFNLVWKTTVEPGTS